MGWTPVCDHDLGSVAANSWSAYIAQCVWVDCLIQYRMFARISMSVRHHLQHYHTSMREQHPIMWCQRYWV